MSYFLGYCYEYSYIYLIMRYIKLKEENLERLEELYRKGSSATVRKRSQCLVLSHQGRNIIDLAKIFSVNRRTIERWFDSWEKKGFGSLPVQPGRGAKTRLEGFEKEVAQQLELHNRNLSNVLDYFKKQHEILICKKTLQNFLKGTGL